MNDTPKKMLLKTNEELKEASLLRITTICGPMFAGKSGELINIVAQAESNGLRYVCYRPADSSRTNDDAKVIKSRSKKITAEAKSLKQSFKIEDLGNFDNMDKIIFDEIHFFDKQSIVNFIETCQQRQKKLDIIFAGLDMDFTGKEFEQTSYVNSISDTTIKLKARCSCKECINKATHSAKISGDLTQQLQAASEDMYKAFCKEHWHEANQMYGVQEFQRQ